MNIATYLLWNRVPNATRPYEQNVYYAIALLIFVTVVFRAEVLLLLGPIVLQALWSGYVKLGKTIKVGVISGIASVGKAFRAYWQQLTDEPACVACFSVHNMRRLVFLATVATLAGTVRHLLQCRAGKELRMGCMSFPFCLLRLRLTQLIVPCEGFPVPHVFHVILTETADDILLVCNGRRGY